MTKLYLLKDYKDHFGSKYGAVPYRSGMAKKILKNCFQRRGFQTEFISFSGINFRSMNFENQFVIYTSSEDKKLMYKTYIEDICFGLEMQGAILIPEMKYLRANNNKVLMEIIRDLVGLSVVKNINSLHFGTFEDLHNKINLINMPCVMKNAAGAQGRDVFLVKNIKDLYKKCKKITKTSNLIENIHEYLRQMKHTGYTRESRYRNKFIIQNFVRDLSNDWKVLIYGNKYFILYRENRKNDFRASGSGNFKFKEETPVGLLDYANLIFKNMNVPHISLDIAYDGDQYYLFEFQAVYFGTTTIEKAPFYYIKEQGEWRIHYSKSKLEPVYVDCIADFIENNF